MPPLASMSISREPQQQPNEDYQGHTGFYNQAPPFRQPMPSPPTEARIQSWADNVTPQQPKPMPPVGQPVANMQGMWSPNMGIKFAQPAMGRGNPNPQAGQQQGGPGTASGAWEPGKGIRFG